MRRVCLVPLDIMDLWVLPKRHLRILGLHFAIIVRTRPPPRTLAISANGIGGLLLQRFRGASVQCARGRVLWVVAHIVVLTQVSLPMQADVQASYVVFAMARVSLAAATTVGSTHHPLQVLQLALGNVSSAKEKVCWADARNAVLILVSLPMHRNDQDSHVVFVAERAN